MIKNQLLLEISELDSVLNYMFRDEEFINSFIDACDIIFNALKEGKKLIVCGNGGSSSDAEHLAGEIVGRFQKERSSLPCVSLCTPSAVFTAIANDYGYENVFARQLQGLGNNGDVLLGFSTSGNSKNIINAINVANNKNIKSIVFTGDFDSTVSHMASLTLKVKSKITSRIQEIHGFLIHCICNLIEKNLFVEE